MGLPLFNLLIEKTPHLKITVRLRDYRLRWDYGDMGEDYLLCQRVAASMSRVGNPYDNSVLSEVEGAKAEPFMRTLKEEEVDGRAFSNETEARDSIGLLIETVYNRHRLH